MGIRRTKEFRIEAVRIALTSGLPQKQVADDLGIGLSTLSKWVAARKYGKLMSGLMKIKTRNWPAFAKRTEYCARSRTS